MRARDEYAGSGQRQAGAVGARDCSASCCDCLQVQATRAVVVTKARAARRPPRPRADLARWRASRPRARSSSLQVQCALVHLIVDIVGSSTLASQKSSDSRFAIDLSCGRPSALAVRLPGLVRHARPPRGTRHVRRSSYSRAQTLVPDEQHEDVRRGKRASEAWAANGREGVAKPGGALSSSN